MNVDSLFFIIKSYYNTKEFNICEMKNILNQIGIFDPPEFKKIEDIIHMSMQIMINKWNKNKKILRTELIYNIIPNYPKEILNKSILIDVVINILDDIYDEKLDKEEISSNILELLRTMAIIYKENFSEFEKNLMFNYFNKILCIAIIEFVYIDKIKYTSNISEKMDLAIDCYNCRSTDIDIFLELPLYELNINKMEIKKLIKIGNIYRAISIISKDITDMKKDMKNETITPIIILSEDAQKTLKYYLKKIISYYEIESNKYIIWENKKTCKIYDNLKNLIKSELCSIRSRIERLN